MTANPELETVLRHCAPLLVAYSGGVDSAYLAYAAQQAVPGQVLAVVADSPSLPRSALQSALAFAAAHAIPCEVIATAEIERDEYRRNQPDRCYHCKDELFRRMEEELRRRGGFRTLAYGVNADDDVDFRPGHRAAAEHGVRAPLREAGLGKKEIRRRARAAGLEVWDRPAAACLASRVAYGVEVTPEVLARIEAGEEALYGLGFRQVRVRYHREIVRLEIARDELPRALTMEMADRLTAIFRQLGFRYITLDLQGYRTGALNEILPAAH
ncbi:MAG: ATP-dependent sacrificial sulfur transferase LarE [Terriglobales bacterium]